LFSMGPARIFGGGVQQVAKELSALPRKLLVFIQEMAYSCHFLCKMCVTAECKTQTISKYVWYSSPGGPTPRHPPSLPLALRALHPAPSLAYSSPEGHAPSLASSSPGGPTPSLASSSRTLPGFL